jgi:hypothetical protein
MTSGCSFTSVCRARISYAAGPTGRPGIDPTLMLIPEEDRRRFAAEFYRFSCEAWLGIERLWQGVAALGRLRGAMAEFLAFETLTLAMTVDLRDFGDRMEDGFGPLWPQTAEETSASLTVVDDFIKPTKKPPRNVRRSQSPEVQAMMGSDLPATDLATQIEQLGSAHCRRADCHCRPLQAIHLQLDRKGGIPSNNVGGVIRLDPKSTARWWRSTAA